MKAAITIETPDRGSTVFPSFATGHVLTAKGIGDPLNGGRLLIFTDDAGYRKVTDLLDGERQRVKVRDIVCGTTHTLERADCGLGCRCAIAITKSEATL